jgi:hypothetical protein
VLSHNRAANAAASVSGNGFSHLRCGRSQHTKNMAQGASHCWMMHAFFHRAGGAFNLAQRPDFSPLAREKKAPSE